MNLKTACIIAIVLTLISLGLAVLGTVINYIPIMIKYFHISMVINAAVSFTTILLQSIGVLVFFMAFVKRLNNPDSISNPGFIIGGGLILLAAILAAALNTVHSVNMAQHMPRTQYLFFLATFIAHFLSGLALSMFALTRATSKPLAALALITQLGMALITIVNMVIHFPSYIQGDILQNVGWITNFGGYLIGLGGLLLFLLAFLVTPKQTTHQQITEPLQSEPLTTSYLE